MNTKTRRLHFTELEALLRDLDAATSSDLDARTDPRAVALLGRVIESRVATTADGGSRSPSTTRRVVRRSLAVTAAAALIGVGSIALPNYFGGSQVLAWSASPQAIPDELLREAEQICTEHVVRDASPIDGTDPSRMRPVISDARGSYILVYLTDGARSPSTSTCYVQDGRVDAVTGALATPGTPAQPAVPANSGRLELGALSSSPAGTIRAVTGRVGSDVVGVVLDTVAKGSVTATVRNGHTAAWWPDAPTTEGQENARTAPEITGATLMLRDGSTRWASVEELSGRTTEELARQDTGGSADGG